MNRKFLILSCAALTLLVAGCERASKTGPFQRDEMMLSTLAGSPQRYVAESHKIEIIAPVSELQKSWEAAAAYCGTIRCEVMSSSIATETSDSVPSGDISLWVAPEAVGKLLAYVETLGKLARHTTERQDETNAVVDTEAEIKNLTSFRDNLRSMLARPSATVKDIVEIQQQLTDTQSELDSETAQRKILANQTEKIAVEISFSAEGRGENARGFAQIWTALRESGSILADSTASLITTVVAIVPWLVLIVPAVWLLFRVWRTVRSRRSRGLSSATPTPTNNC